MAIEERLKSFEQSRQNMIRKKYGSYSHEEYPKWIKDKDNKEVLVENKVAERVAMGLPASMYPDEEPEEDNVYELDTPQLPKGYKYYEYPKWIKDPEGKDTLVEDREHELEVLGTKAAEVIKSNVAPYKNKLQMKMTPDDIIEQIRKEKEEKLSKITEPSPKVSQPTKDLFEAQEVVIPAQSNGNKTVTLTKPKTPFK